MKKISFLLGLLFLLSSNVFAGDVVVPDISGADWVLHNVQQVYIPTETLQPDGSPYFFLTTARYYVNDKDKLIASTLLWNNQEVALAFNERELENLYVRVALKVKGKWYPAKERGILALHFSVVLDKDNKPAAYKLSLESANGSKELVLKISQ